MRQPAKRRPRPSRQWKEPRNPKEQERQRKRLEQEIAERVNDYHFEERDPLEEIR